MTKITNKKANEKKRNEVIEEIREKFPDEDIIQVANNKMAFPFVNELGSDEWVEITISIPTGARGDGGYDGYEQGEAYQQKIKEKEEKERIKKEEKEKKKERDKKMREKKRKEKEEREKDNK